MSQRLEVSEPGGARVRAAVGMPVFRHLLTTMASDKPLHHSYLLVLPLEKYLAELL